MNSCTSNFQVFNTVVKPMVNSFLEGINTSLLMYGPTGAGKTYTMIGDEMKRKNLRELSDPYSFIKGSDTHSEDAGALFYALDCIFKELANQSGINVLKVSYIEIYNDCVYDLLQEKTRLVNPLSINETEPGKFAIKGIIEQPIKNLSEVLMVIKQGERNRHYAESVMNHSSSRSHAIFQVKLDRVNTDCVSRSEIVCVLKICIEFC